MSTAEQIIVRLKEAVDRNGGQPPSSRSFLKEAGLNQRDLIRAGWPTYGALLKSQGFQPAVMKRGFTDDEVFRPLAELTVRLGHFPTQSEREVERHRNPAFPSSEAYLRRGRRAMLEHALRAWCEATHDFSELVPKLKQAAGAAQIPGPIVKGYVYMLRDGNSGKRVKIGKESVEGARQAAAATWLGNPRAIHRIATDDPDGIEEYWHERFKKAGKHVVRELFDLLPSDIAAFKAWKKIV
jgi:hypothetical protein